MTAACRSTVLLALLGAVLAGCGVRTEDVPREVDPPDGVSHAWATEAQPGPLPDAGAIPERLYFVRGGEIVPVTRYVQAEPSVEELVDDLLGGLTDAERRDGLTSALVGNEFVGGVQRTGGLAKVELTAALDETGRTDQILAFAQIVCTLTTKPGITAVAFTRGGQVVGVPRADGSLSEAPASYADYASLLAGN